MKRSVFASFRRSSAPPSGSLEAAQQMLKQRGVEALAVAERATTIALAVLNGEEPDLAARASLTEGLTALRDEIEAQRAHVIDSLNAFGRNFGRTAAAARTVRAQLEGD